MLTRRKNSISLIPEPHEAWPDILDRIHQDFVEHLTIDRRIDFDKAQEQATEILDRECGAIRSLDQSDFLCILQNGRKVGVLWKSARQVSGRGTWHVLYIEILQPNRKKGIAERAMNELIVLAKKDHVSEITLNVSPRNTPALALYKKLGFLPRDRALVLAIGG
jgi:ribosomal protein S18 acetylase RimI-like enzyme